MAIHVKYSRFHSPISGLHSSSDYVCKLLSDTHLQTYTVTQVTQLNKYLNILNKHIYTILNTNLISYMNLIGRTRQIIDCRRLLINHGSFKMITIHLKSEQNYNTTFVNLAYISNVLFGLL